MTVAISEVSLGISPDFPLTEREEERLVGELSRLDLPILFKMLLDAGEGEPINYDPKLVKRVMLDKYSALTQNNRTLSSEISSVKTSKRHSHPRHPIDGSSAMGSINRTALRALRAGR